MRPNLILMTRWNGSEVLMTIVFRPLPSSCAGKRYSGYPAAFMWWPSTRNLKKGATRAKENLESLMPLILHKKKPFLLTDT